MSMGVPPNCLGAPPWGKVRSMKPVEILLMRVETRMHALGLNDNQLSNAVAGHGYVIRDLRKGAMPGGARLIKLAEVLQTTPGWLLGQTEIGGFPDAPTPGAAAAAKLASPRRSFGAQPITPAPITPPARAEMPKDVPVLGNAIGTSAEFSNGTPVELAMMEMGEVVDRVRRPPSLADVRTAYALYIMGDSQSPRFEPGELVFIHPHKPVAPGDDVVVQLVDDDDCVNCALIKRLVRRTASEVELQQFNPAKTFTVPTARIRAIHRIMNAADLYGI